MIKKLKDVMLAETMCNLDKIREMLKFESEEDILLRDTIDIIFDIQQKNKDKTWMTKD